MTRPILLAAMIAVPMLSAPALAQDADTVVATVGDEQITLGQMIVMKQSIQDPNMAHLPDQALWDMMLDQLIRQTAVAQSAKEDAGVRAQLELQRRNTLASAAVSRARQNLNSPASAAWSSGVGRLSGTWSRKVASLSPGRVMSRDWSGRAMRRARLTTSVTDVLNRSARARANSSLIISPSTSTPMRRHKLKNRDFWAAVVPILTSERERMT